MIDSVEINFSLPKNIAIEDRVLFEKDMHRTLPTVHTHTLENVNLTKEGIIFKKLKTYEYSLVWPDHKKTYNIGYILRTLILRKKNTLPGNDLYVACFDYWSHGYFHWICDFLPRLHILKEFLNDFVLILPENYRDSFFEESLKAYGIERAYKIPDNTYLHCPNLHIIDRISPSGEHNPEIIKKVRDTLFNYYKKDFQHITYPERIYVSRAKSRYRKVTNEKEVIALLTDYGFQVVYFEDYSLSQQIAISYHANIMVSLHGAGLTNLLFMNNTSSVLEFRTNSPDHVNCYFLLAASLDVNYYYQLSEYIDRVPTGGHSYDITVNLKTLQQNIELMLSS